MSAVTYSLVLRKNPANKMASPKFYAHPQARGEVNIRTISERIQRSCTVTFADIMAVLSALESVVADSLSNGEIVRLGDLGSLQVSFSSKGANTTKEFNPTLISHNRILFRAGLVLGKMKDTLKYERVAKKSEQGFDKTPGQEPGADEGLLDPSPSDGTVSGDQSASETTDGGAAEGQEKI